MSRDATVAERNDSELEFRPGFRVPRVSTHSRTTAKYIAWLALAVVIFHWKTLLTDQFTSLVGSEGINQAYAWLHFWVKSVWSGHIPLWDPYAWGGRPFAGETQTSSYYPLRLLFALVPLNRNGLVSPRFYHEYRLYPASWRRFHVCAHAGIGAESFRSFSCRVLFLDGGSARQTSVASSHGSVHLDAGYSALRSSRDAC